MQIFSIKPEMILYFYMASCIAVLVFNLLYIAVDQIQKRQQGRRHLDLETEILRQMKVCRKQGTVEDSHVEAMKRRLVRLRSLKVFEESLEKVREEASDRLFRLYLLRMRGVFLYLTDIYAKRDVIEKAYYCSIIEKFLVDAQGQGTDGIIEFLLYMAAQGDVYVRENALKALYRMGNPDAILSAWRIMSDNEINHSLKLLSDGLLKFSGDKETLAWLLWRNRGDVSTHLELAAMQFIRFSSGDFQQEFLELLDREEEEKELRLEAIRYLRRFPYEPAREILQNFIRYQEFIDWEYAAMAASSLSCYPGEDTVSCLKEGLSAVNWYVRLNCAEALINGLKLPKLRLFDIYNGRDRYAREILHYVLKKSEIKGQEMELSE